MPPNERNTDLPLLGAVIGKLDKINRKYGDNWHDYLYKSDYDIFVKRLTMNERKYIAQLCVEYKLAGGFILIVDIYNSQLRKISLEEFRVGNTLRFLKSLIISIIYFFNWPIRAFL